MMAEKVLKTSASVFECVAAKAANGKEWKASVASSAYSRDVQGLLTFVLDAVGVRVVLGAGKIVGGEARVGEGATGVWFGILDGDDWVFDGLQGTLDFSVRGTLDFAGVVFGAAEAFEVPSLLLLESTIDRTVRGSLATLLVAVIGAAVIGAAVKAAEMTVVGSVFTATFIAGSLLGSYAGVDHKVRLRFGGGILDTSA